MSQLNVLVFSRVENSSQLYAYSKLFLRALGYAGEARVIEHLVELKSRKLNWKAFENLNNLIIPI